jgi:hypothetical protein
MFSDATSSCSAPEGANVSEIEQGHCGSGTYVLLDCWLGYCLRRWEWCVLALYAFWGLVNTEVSRRGNAVDRRRSESYELQARV